MGFTGRGKPRLAVKQAPGSTATNALGKKKQKAEQPKKKMRIEDMDVDELLRGNFLDDEAEEQDERGNAEHEDQSGDENMGEDSDEEEEGGSQQEDDSEEDFVDVTPADAAGDSASEEEDEEGEEHGGSKKGKQRSKSEMDKHRKELEVLKAKDPEFYKFLEDHDQDLLEFGDDDEDEDEEEQEEDEEEGDKKKKKKQAKVMGEEDSEAGPAQGEVLTSAMVDAWSKAALEKKSFGAIKSLLRAFRIACHYGDGSADELGSSLTIASSHVFSKVMLFVLREMDGLLRFLLAAPPDTKKGAATAAMAEPPPLPSPLQKSTRWRKVEPLAKSYLGNALHILGQMTDATMIAFALRRLRPSIPMLVAFPKFGRRFLKTALHYWSSEESGSLPIASAVFIRELALHLGPDMLEATLRGSYRSYAATVKFVNASSFARVDMMARLLVEIYGLDPVASYQQAYVFIRQLAFALRTALTTKTQEACRAVYGWQFIGCLSAWTRIVSVHAAHDVDDAERRDTFRPLVYPLTQIILGTAQLVPTARFFPLRLQCVRMLTQLSRATEQFIPVAPLLLGMLSFADLRRSLTGGGGQARDFSVMIRVPKQDLRTRAFQEDCVSSVVELLAEHLALWSCSVAFPELALVPLVQLRKFVKETAVERFRRQVKQLIDQIERNVEFVLRKRERVNFAPKDMAAVSAFLQEEKKGGTSPMAVFSRELSRKSEERRAQLRAKDVVFGGSPKKAKKVVSEEKRGVGRDSDEEEEDEEEGEEEALDGRSKVADVDRILDEDGDVDKEGEAAFRKGWLPGKESMDLPKKGKGKRKVKDLTEEEDDDIVEDLILSDNEAEAEEEEVARSDEDHDEDEVQGVGKGWRKGNGREKAKRKRPKSLKGSERKVQAVGHGNGVNAPKRKLKKMSKKKV